MTFCISKEKNASVKVNTIQNNKSFDKISKCIRFYDMVGIHHVVISSPYDSS